MIEVSTTSHGRRIPCVCIVDADTVAIGLHVADYIVDATQLKGIMESPKLVWVEI